MDSFLGYGATVQETIVWLQQFDPGYLVLIENGYDGPELVIKTERYGKDVGWASI